MPIARANPALNQVGDKRIQPRDCTKKMRAYGRTLFVVETNDEDMNAHHLNHHLELKKLICEMLKMTYRNLLGTITDRMIFLCPKSSKINIVYFLN